MQLFIRDFMNTNFFPWAGESLPEHHFHHASVGSSWEGINERNR